MKNTLLLAIAAAGMCTANALQAYAVVVKNDAAIPVTFNIDVAPQDQHHVKPSTSLTVSTGQQAPQKVMLRVYNAMYIVEYGFNAPAVREISVLADDSVYAPTANIKAPKRLPIQ